MGFMYNENEDNTIVTQIVYPGRIITDEFEQMTIRKNDVLVTFETFWKGILFHTNNADT